MTLKKHFFSVAAIGLMVLSNPAQAEQPVLKEFITGSYRQILTSNDKKPFVLVIWSINCSSCLKDMALLSDIHKKRPELKMIMLATDDISETGQIQSILEDSQLSGIENWVYAEENTQKLQFEIDPKWYGELPRTYFFDIKHQREGISGILSKENYESRFDEILN